MYNKYQTIFINILRYIIYITWCLLNISGYLIYISGYLYISVDIYVSWYLYISADIYRYQLIFININWYIIYIAWYILNIDGYIYIYQWIFIYIVKMKGSNFLHFYTNGTPYCLWCQTPITGYTIVMHSDVCYIAMTMRRLNFMYVYVYVLPEHYQWIAYRYHLTAWYSTSSLST